MVVGVRSHYALRVGGNPPPPPTPTPTPTPTSGDPAGSGCTSAQTSQACWYIYATRYRDNVLGDRTAQDNMKIGLGYLVSIILDITQFINGGAITKLEALLDFAADVASFQTYIASSVAHWVGLVSILQGSLHLAAHINDVAATIHQAIAWIKGATVFIQWMIDGALRLIFGVVGEGPSLLLGVIEAAIGPEIESFSHELIASAYDDLAEVDRQQNMSIVDWCNQYRGCPTNPNA